MLCFLQATPGTYPKGPDVWLQLLAKICSNGADYMPLKKAFSQQAAQAAEQQQLIKQLQKQDAEQQQVIAELQQQNRQQQERCAALEQQLAQVALGAALHQQE